MRGSDAHGEGELGRPPLGKASQPDRDRQTDTAGGAASPRGSPLFPRQQRPRPGSGPARLRVGADPPQWLKGIGFESPCALPVGGTGPGCPVKGSTPLRPPGRESCSKLDRWRLRLLLDESCFSCLPRWARPSGAAGTGTPGEAEVTAASPIFYSKGSPGMQPVLPEGCGAGARPAVSGVTGNGGKLPGWRGAAHRGIPLGYGRKGPASAGIPGLRFSGGNRGSRAEPIRAASRRGDRRLLRRAPCSHRSPTWLL